MQTKVLNSNFTKFTKFLVVPIQKMLRLLMVQNYNLIQKIQIFYHNQILSI